QRVALARALAVEPRVLLLDEPFGALDAKVRKELRRWLRQLHEEVHLTTVFVTHDQEEALEIADEVVIMNRAQIEQVGTPQDVYDRPASPFVYQFLGNVNQVRLPIRGVDSLRALTTSADGSVAYVRPHDIDLARHVAGVPGEPALVRSIHAAGPFARVRCTRGREDEIVEAELPRSRLSELRLSIGDAVLLRLRDSKIPSEDFSI
ncbi:MAG: TOBE-like domain-containing protein, partial [Opitutaceae bacterium]|nr:TOBE-like domain-containing protein [Opitutaceae bacterium]